MSGSVRPVRVIRPAAVTDDVLISSPVAETDLPQYSAGTTYAEGDVVMVVAEHAIYRSRQDANTGHPPATSADWWKRVRATNRWAMFDLATLTTATQAASPLQVVLRPGSIGGVALFGVQGSQVDVELTDYATGAQLAFVTGIIADQFIDDWYEYFTAPPAERGDVAFVDLPICGTSELTVSVYGADQVAVAALAAGPVYTLGVAEDGLSARRLNASRFVTDDETGAVTIDARPTQRRTDVRFTLPTERLNKVVSLFDALDNVICAWLPVPEGGFESLNVLGWHRDTTVSLPRYGIHTCNTQLLGVT